MNRKEKSLNHQKEHFERYVKVKEKKEDICDSYYHNFFTHLNKS
jgi:hypothetical protein